MRVITEHHILRSNLSVTQELYRSYIDEWQLSSPVSLRSVFHNPVLVDDVEPNIWIDRGDLIEAHLELGLRELLAIDPKCISELLGDISIEGRFGFL